jgi:hypothetical protein
LIEPDIVKELREEEKQGLLNNKNINSKNETGSKQEKFKELDLILKLQKDVIEDFLSKIKKGEFKTSKSVVFSLNELLNYYNSDYWKILSDEISIDKHILSFFHLVNTYIEHLESSTENNEPNIDKDKNFDEIKKLKNVILTLNSIRG